MGENKSTRNERSSLSRRELLKVLAASSGALTLGAFLPQKWVKPVIQAGVVPAHAQGTCPYVAEITEAIYEFNNQWAVNVHWTPSSPGTPVFVSATFGGLPAPIIDGCWWYGDPGATTGAGFECTRNASATGWDFTVRFDWYGARTCIVTDTYTVTPPV